MKHVTVGIIGATHGIGESFAQFFRAYRSADMQVLVAGRTTQLTPAELVQQSDIVIFSVPIETTIPLIEELSPLARPDQIWSDFTSIKQPIVEALLKTDAQVCGMHPLFGPMKNLWGQKVVLTPSRIEEESMNHLRYLFRDMTLLETSAQQHDRLMGAVQVVSHFSDFVMGETLRRSGMDFAQVRRFSSPSYELKLEVMGRMFAQNPDLYAQINTRNRAGLALQELFAESSQDLLALSRESRTEELAGNFRDIAGYLGDSFCHTAHSRTQAMMEMKGFSLRPEQGDAPDADVLIFGEAHSHTDEASFHFEVRQSTPRIGYRPQIKRVVEEVATGRASYGIIPYENTLHGSVVETMDALFAHPEVQITASVFRPIHQHLIGLPGTGLSDIRRVCSHPQALFQCREWLEAHLPHVQTLAELSTTRAAARVRAEQDPSLFAIAPRHAAEDGLQIIQEDIQGEQNHTRFVQIERANEPPEGDITALVFWFSQDKSGSLAKVLTIFSDHAVNLTKIDSRRAKPQYGGYLFFVDAQKSPEALEPVLNEITPLVGGLRVLGAFCN